MRYLLIVLFLSFSAGSVDYHIKPTPVFFEMDENYHNWYNGRIEKPSNFSWLFESHTNDSCVGSGSKCRKVAIEYEVGPWIKDQYTKYVFYFTLDQFSMTDSPDWLIIYQLWGDLYPNINGGNHPITTLKIKNIAGKLWLQQYENSWQFDFTQFNGHNKEHDHVLESKKGEYQINVGQTYRIEITIHDGHLIDYGHVQTKIDEYIMSSSVYQTKQWQGKHVSYFGQYWSKGYNEDNNTNLKIKTRVENLAVMSSDEGID